MLQYHLRCMHGAHLQLLSTGSVGKKDVFFDDTLGQGTTAEAIIGESDRRKNRIFSPTQTGRALGGKRGKEELVRAATGF